MKTTIKIFTAIVLSSLSVTAQTAKLKITPAAYGKWGTLSGENISPDGKWASFKMEYDSQLDTLFVVNTDNHVKMNFPGAQTVSFSSDSKRLVITLPEKKIRLIEIATQHSITLEKVTSFDFLSDGKYVIIQDDIAGGKALKLTNHTGSVLWQYDNVDAYKINKKEEVAIACAGGVLLLSTGKMVKSIPIIKDSTAAYTALTWDKSGNNLACFKSAKQSVQSTSVVHYNNSTKQIKQLDGNKLVFKGKLYEPQTFQIILSENGRSVYFTTMSAEKPAQDTIAEVWDSGTVLEYPEDQIDKIVRTGDLLTVWDIDTQSVRQFDDDQFFDTKILHGEKYALTQDRSSITSQIEEVRSADYYCLNLITNERTLIVTQGKRSAGAVKASPSGQYVNYFKNGGYFVFNNETGKTTNITENVGTNFNDIEFDDAGENLGYHTPGFTTDSRFLIVHDQYDVWLFSPDGKIKRKITDGRKTKTQFRVVVHLNDITIGNFAAAQQERVDINKGIILSARGHDKSSGYFLYDEKSGLRKVTYGKFKVSKIRKAKTAETYLYTEETDAVPPSIMISKKRSDLPQNIYQSNAHYEKFESVHSELITYTNSKGGALQGVLRYPTSYVEGKKYPMVVYIYERLSHTLYDYSNPVLRHHIGFSPANYYLDGYFVLLPDIVYEVGKPGQSSVDCVVAAVNSVKKRGFVEENHIGLIGHSYGGTQTTFIITQTPIFAAAVGSGAVTDLVSSYLTMNFTSGRSNIWRFEAQQFRMGSSPFDNWDGYIKNSAIAHVANITTPLLSWSGKDDMSVDFRQSIEMHLALRRLKKVNTLLLFPDQDHILRDHNAQAYLTEKVKQWFDSYLKPDNL